jgi:CRP/FNR family transcriptional regulator, cyclic AMP receptor protein
MDGRGAAVRRRRRTRGAAFAADAAVTLRAVGETEAEHAGGFLGRLDPGERAEALRLGRPRRYQRGARMVVQGDLSDTVFLLLEGRVKVTSDTPDGREVVLSVLGPGDLLGEFEALDPLDRRRSAGNVALEPVDCRSIPATELVAFLESHPRLALVVLQEVVRRLRAADRRRSEAASLDTPHRLAQFLVELHDLHGRPAAEGTDIDVPLTQEELASVIAASRDAVVRALGSLRARGLVLTDRRRIVVRDVEGLRRYAG